MALFMRLTQIQTLRNSISTQLCLSRVLQSAWNYYHHDKEAVVHTQKKKIAAIYHTMDSMVCFSSVVAHCSPAVPVDLIKSIWDKPEQVDCTAPAALI